MSIETQLTETATSLTVVNNEEKTIRKPLFVIFAEFLGYESPFIDWADKLCKGEEIEDYQRQFVNIDAEHIFKKMQEKYTLKEIRQWYDMYYDTILAEYESTLMMQKMQS